VLIGYHTSEYPVRTAEFPGKVLVFKDWPHGAVMEAWRRSMLALVPSMVAETFGIVALEAMLMGRPVIASRIGGLPDLVVNGATGLLVPPGDAMALRQAIQRLLADAALRERLGRAGRARARLFTASAVLPRLEAIYREVAGGLTPGP
jgi:glycosyltransferase involved in cell wall biosynthesis